MNGDFSKASARVTKALSAVPADRAEEFVLSLRAPVIIPFVRIVRGSRQAGPFRSQVDRASDWLDGYRSAGKAADLLCASFLIPHKGAGNRMVRVSALIVSEDPEAVAAHVARTAVVFLVLSS